MEIVALQETRWPGQGTKKDKNYTYFYSGNQNDKHIFGVAIAVSNKIRGNVLSFQPVNERVCAIRIRAKFSNVSYVSFHAPTEEADDEMKDHFYEELEAVVDSLPSYDFKLLLGDANAKCEAIDSVQIGLAEPPNEISNSGHDDHPNACQLLLMMYNNFQCKAIDSVQIGLAEPPNEISNSGHDDHPNACHRPTNKHTSKTSRIFEELHSIFGDDKERCPTFEELQNMPVLDRCIKEVLRMYPPGYIIARRIRREIKIGDYDIPKDATIMNYIYAMHRDPNVYENPDQFNPDRFLPEKFGKYPKYNYQPFAAGNRKCIAYKYAMLQMKIVISTVLRHFKILPSPRYKTIDDLKYEMRVTLT
ncbi:cytochrome P450 4e3-like [Diaphorina citri]|uniref:Cytochrome P450 4e3-like n=1 Tax=Diaphorina citri TaxID=121845 RepID=A0A3Q0IRL0_DIACI|nr:cytochrome P450 4e3-like [Diaphorina citri]